MTDLAELEPPIVIANRLRSRAAVYTEEGRHNAWGQLMLDAEATILSLIERVEKAEAELLEAREDEASLLLIAHMDGADNGRKAAARITDLEADNARLREALKEIARQPLAEAMNDEDLERASFEDGYDYCVRRARAALAGQGDDK